jgi:DNA-binding protein YbaB
VPFVVFELDFSPPSYLERLASILEEAAEKKLEKYFKRGLGDYMLTLSISTKGSGEVEVAADIEIRSSVFNKEDLELIIDDVVSTVRDKADEVIGVKRGKRGTKGLTKSQKSFDNNS